jgi:cytoskeletal protein RodZ
LAAYLEDTGKNETEGTEESAGKDSLSKPEQETSSSSSPLKAVLGFGVALIVVGAGAYWFSTREAPKPDRQPQAQLATQAIPQSEPDPAEKEADPVPSESEEPVESPAEEAAPPPEPAGTTPAPEAAAPATPDSQTPEDSQPIKNTVTVPEKSDTIKDLQDQSVSKPEVISAEETPGEQSLKLVIRVEENAWFNLTVDDQRDQDFILPAGGSKTIDAKSAIVMTIGNRRATQLTLNGQAMELPESPDNVIRNLIVNAEQLN